MKYKNVLLVVHDIDRSIDFYKKVLGLHVILDFKGHVTLKGGICLQSYETWKDCIHKNDDEILFPSHNQELYFEEEDLDIFVQKLNQYNITLVHPLKEQRWGQRVVRFYDPDGHIIEVGESLKKVAKRFISQGLSHEEVAKRMGVPVDYIMKIVSQ